MQPPVKPDGQWLRKLAKYGLCILIHRQNRPAFSVAERSPSVRLWVTTGRREKWREKDKTTVGWRAFEVLKPRSWDPGPETSRWGPEPQVLRARSWNPGPESQALKPRVEVLKPRSWERACVINWLKQLTGTH